jgi:hypothetical protein
VTSFLNDWEGIGSADQTTLTAAISDDGGGTAITGLTTGGSGAVKIEKGASNVPDGSVAVRCQRAVASDIAGIISSIYNAAGMRVRAKIRLPQAMPSEQLLVIRTTGNALMARVQTNASNQLQVVNRAGATLFTSATLPSYPCDVTLDFGVEKGTTGSAPASTDGKVRFRYYLGRSQVAAETMADNDATDTGQVNAGIFHLGLAAAGATVGSVYIDDIAADDTAITAQGPFTFTAPTKVADRGSTTNVAAGATTTVAVASGAAIAVGNYLIARVAVNNSGASGARPGLTVTDTHSNTWTVGTGGLADPGAINAGIATYIAYCKVTTGFANADDITFTWGTGTPAAKAIVVEEWANIDGTTPVNVAEANTSGTATPATASITPTVANALVYVACGVEGIAGDTYTEDADSTNGTWTSLTRLASADATATNNALIEGGYKVVSASGAQSWSATITSRDWATAIISFAPPTVTHSADATVSPTAALTGTASSDKPVTSTLANTATLSGTASSEKPVTSTLAATATLTADASVVKSVDATLANTATLTAAANIAGSVAKTFDFEGGTGNNTVTITTSDTGSGDLITDRQFAGSPTLQYSTDQAMHGTYSGHAVAVATTQQSSLGWLGYTATDISVRFYFRLNSAAPTVGTHLCQVRHSGNAVGIALNLAISGGNARLTVLDRNGSTIFDPTTGNNLSVGTWYRAEVRTTANTATSGPFNGTVTHDLYAGDSSTPLYTGTALTNVDNNGSSATNTLTTVRIGKPATTGGTLDVYLDDLAVQDALGSYIGPASATHSATATLANTATIAATASVVKGVDATLAGTATLSASADLAGAGNWDDAAADWDDAVITWDSVSGAATLSAQATVSPTATLSGTATTTKPVEAARITAVDLTTAFEAVKPVTSTLANTATLTGTAASDKPVTATLAATATLTAAASVTKPVTSTLANTATLTATLEQLGTQSATATLDLTAAATATATSDKPVTSTLSGTATLTATASVTKSVDAAVSTTATLAATSAATKPIDATLANTVTMVASSGTPITATLANTATLTASATSDKPVDASLAVTAALTGAGASTKPVEATLAGTATLTAAASVVTVQSATASLAGTAAITATASVVKGVTATLAVTDTITADAVKADKTVEATPLAVTATIAATASVVKGVDATLTVTSTADLTAAAVKSAQATLTALATPAVTAAIVPQTTPGQMTPRVVTGPRMYPVTASAATMTRRQT